MSKKRLFSHSIHNIFTVPQRKDKHFRIINRARNSFQNIINGARGGLVEEKWGFNLARARAQQCADLVSAEGQKSQEVLTPIPDNLEELCEVGFLQKIVDSRTKLELWFCLKNQRLYGKGKPILIADGRDRHSIQKLCARAFYMS